MEHKEISEKIIGCAYRVFNEMGFGFLESVYEKCLMIELGKAGIKALNQQPVHVNYRGEPVGDFFADMIVEDKVVVELKSVSKIIKAHEVQLVNYLTATGLPVGLLINFAENGVEIKRKVRQLKRAFDGQVYHPVNPVDPV